MKQRNFTVEYTNLQSKAVHYLSDFQYQTKKTGDFTTDLRKAMPMTRAVATLAASRAQTETLTGKVVSLR